VSTIIWNLVLTISHDAYRFPTRAEVDRANETKMAKLAGMKYTFTAVDSGTVTDPVQRGRLLANCMAPPVLELKKGSQVMLIKNMEETLVNGSLGKVVAFMDETTWDYHYENDDDFTESQDVDDRDEEDIRRREELKRKIYKNPNSKQGRLWPLVQFTLPDGTYRRLLCQPEAWNVELPSGEVQAQRQQVPLILAWALSIHKAQGQTLERVKVDMGRIFEKGQAYVALSRATCQAGLQILNFDPKKIMAHPRVITFYENLYSVNMATSRSKAMEAKPASEHEQNFIEVEDDFEEEEKLMSMYG
jgi:ATP-dependent DNA helicase PIF1